MSRIKKLDPTGAKAECVITVSPKTYEAVFSIDKKVIATLYFEYGETIVAPEVPEKDGYSFSWSDFPETMSAHDVDIHGTYTEISSVDEILVDGNTRVTVCTINGRILYRNVPWQDVKDKLEGGLYIINGTKYLIRR